MKSAAVVISLALGTTVICADDPCAPLIPSSLKTRLESTFPDLRAPQATDNLPEDVQYNRTHGGSGCLGVASGDFDGDGAIDTLVGLANREGTWGRVVVALARGAGWDLRTLAVWPVRNRLFVEVHPAGTYHRTDA